MIARWLVLIGLALSGLFSSFASAADKEVIFPTLTLSVLRYVEWNGEDKIANGEVIRVGVYDKTRGRRYMKEFERLCNESELFELVNMSDSEQAEENTDVVYIAGESTRLPRSLLASLQTQTVLVIGEHEDILNHGGIIRFQVSSSKNAEMGINLKQAKASSLSIRSRLLGRAIELIE